MRKQRMAHAATSIVGMNDDVVDVEQRLGGEGGETKKAVDQADSMAINEGQRAIEVGNFAQAFDQGFLRVFGKSVAAAHRIAGVVIEQGQQARGMFGVVEFGGDDDGIHDADNSEDGLKKAGMIASVHSIRVAVVTD